MLIRQLHSLFLFCLVSYGLSGADLQPDITEEHFFDENILPAIQAELSKATRSIVCAAYELNHRNIIDLLKKRKSHGINVEVVLAQQSPQKEKLTKKLIEELSEADIPVWQTWDHAHDKILIIDETTVITGSFNYTHSGPNQKNNIIVITAKNQAGIDQVITPYTNHVIGQKHRSNAENNSSQIRKLTERPAYVAPEDDAQLCRCGPVFAEPALQSSRPLTNLVCSALRSARHSVICAYFDFDNEQIAEELCKTSKKKIPVNIMACQWQINQKIEKEYSQRLRAFMQVATEKTRPGSTISLIGHRPANQIMHNKFMIIDNNILLTGSANATNQADKQWENIYVSTKNHTISAFKEYFSKLVVSGLAIPLSTFAPTTPISMFNQLPARPQDWVPQRFIGIHRKPIHPSSTRAQRMLASAFAEAETHATSLKRSNTTDSDASDRATKRANSPGVLD